MAFYTEWDAMFALHNWKFEQASSSVVDSGTGGHNFGVVLGNPTEQQTGPIDEALPDYATLYDGVDDAHESSAAFGEGDAQGVVAMVFKSTDNAFGYMWASWTQYTTNRSIVAVQWLGDGNIQFLLQNDNSPLDRRKWLSSGLSLNDGEWHLVLIRQPNDGSGLDIFVDDGVNPSTAFTESADGSGVDADGWFLDALNNSTVSDGSAVGDINNSSFWNGEMALLGYDDTSPTDQAVADLFAETPFLGPDFSNKTIRRPGRRLTFDFTTIT